MSERDGTETGSDPATDEDPAATDEHTDAASSDGAPSDGEPSSTPPAADESSDDASAAATDETPADRLDEIASQPADDADRALRDIAAEAVEVPGADGDLRVGDDGEPAFEPADIEVDDALVERVAETDAEALAREIATLQLRVAALESETGSLRSEVDDLESRLARKQADFQNYKQRQQRRLEQEKARATEDLVERLLDVRDNLQRALEQDEDADIRGGVESTLRGFDQELDREGVSRIEPEPGDATEPQRHEVLMRVASDRPADTVAEVHRPGYEMGEKVLRPAQVTVSEGPSEDEAARAGSDGDADDEGAAAAEADDDSRGDGAAE